MCQHFVSISEMFSPIIALNRLRVEVLGDFLYFSLINELFLNRSIVVIIFSRKYFLFSDSISSSAEFCEGMIVNRVMSQRKFGDLRQKVHLHLSGAGVGGKRHVSAVSSCAEEDERVSRVAQVYQRLLQVCLTVIKMKAGASHFEEQIGLLSSNGVDVGSLDHSR